MFDLIGITPVQKFKLPTLNSPLHWLNNTIRLREDIKTKFEWASSSIIVAIAYNRRPSGLEKHPSYMTISKYAAIRDYHKILPKRLKKLLLDHIYPNLPADKQEDFRFKIHSDSFPIYEKGYAQTTLGGIRGLNNLWHSSMGSFVFLGGIITNIDYPTLQILFSNNNLYETVIFEDSPIRFPHNAIRHTMCSSCKSCLINCPTNALTPFFQLHRCLGFWTAEHKGLIPHVIQEKMRNILFGCDICQNTCPYNKTVSPQFSTKQLKKRFGNVIKTTWHIRELERISQQGFYKLFRGTPVIRMKFSKFKDRILWYIKQRENEL